MKNIFSKKVYVLIGLLSSLLFASVSSFVSIPKVEVPFKNPRSRITGTPTLTDTPISTPSAKHGGTVVTVTSVVDGDTIKIEGGEIVRYIGIDTPETVDPRRPVGCYGKEASLKNRSLVLGKTVELEKDVSNRDSFGRLLRYVWLGDTMINEQLVREGFALVSTYPPDVKYVDTFLVAEQHAKTNAVGLWGDVCVGNISSPSATVTQTP